MSNLNSYNDGFSEDEREKKNKKSFYSSRDFVPGFKGILIKLLVSFIMFLISTSLIVFIFTYFMPLKETMFIVYYSVIMMFATWGASVLLKEKANIVKIIPIVLFTAAAYWFSPYVYYLSAVVLIYNLIVALVALSRINLPERLSLSQSLVFLSCLFFCLYQIIYGLTSDVTESTKQAMPLFTIVGVSWIIISLFVLNMMSISRDYSKKKLSKSLIIGNVTLTFLFAGLILIISNISDIKDNIINFFKKAILFFLRGAEPEEVPIEIPAAESVRPDFSQLGGESKTSFFWDFMEKVIYIIMIVGMAFLMYLIIKAFIRFMSNLIIKAKIYFKGNDSAKAISSFEDKEESVFDKKNYNIVFKNKINEIMKRFKRKEKFSELEDNRKKVRFLYKSFILQKVNEQDPLNTSLTAKEIIFEDYVTIEKKKFLSGYEKARYSSHSVSDEEVNAGLSITGKKHEPKS